MNEIEKVAEDLVFSIVPYEEGDFQLSDFRKIPLEELAALGSELADFVGGLTDLLPSSTTVESKVAFGTKDLYRAVVPEGAHLANAKGGGYRGSVVVDGKGVTGQAVFHDAGDLTATVTTKVPVDPATLAVAVALADISAKLDEIQDTQKRMFDYIKNESLADLQASFESLGNTMRNYRFNWNDDAYRAGVYAQIHNIKQEAYKQISFSKQQIESVIEDKKLISLDADAKKGLDEVRPEFDKYRAALYLFSATSLFEASLLKEGNSTYFENVANEIEQRRLEYRETYTKCYNRLEKLSRSAVEGMVLHGASKATSVLAKAVAKTPLGDRTQLDESLEQAGRGLGRLNKKRTTELMEKLLPVKDCDVSPLAEQVRDLDLLLNKSVELLSDGESLYFRQLEMPKDKADI